MSVVPGWQHVVERLTKATRAPCWWCSTGMPGDREISAAVSTASGAQAPTSARTGSVPRASGRPVAGYLAQAAAHGLLGSASPCRHRPRSTVRRRPSRRCRPPTPAQTVLPSRSANSSVRSNAASKRSRRRSASASEPGSKPAAASSCRSGCRSSPVPAGQSCARRPCSAVEQHSRHSSARRPRDSAGRELRAAGNVAGDQGGLGSECFRFGLSGLSAGDRRRRVTSRRGPQSGCDDRLPAALGRPGGPARTAGEPALERERRDPGARSPRQCLVELRRSARRARGGCLLISPRDVALRPGRSRSDVEVLLGAVAEATWPAWPRCSPRTTLSSGRV